ncbi:MAG TPA: hypothetical protein VF173_14875 [Thermoanaerobaculia bacterium]|nr:hypothetical protein [Thermoanaerobaculia bacterium]
MEPLDSPHETRLRQALDPTPDAVERVVHRALASPRPAPALRLLPAASLIAVLLVAAVLLLRPLTPRRAVASIETVGEVLLVRPQNGPVSIVNPGREPGSPSGTLIVVYGGGQ